jgi:hypothetical protein
VRVVNERVAIHDRSRTPLSHNDEIRVPDFKAVFDNA